MTTQEPAAAADHHDWLSSEYVDAWVADWSGRRERPAELRRVAVALPLRRDAAISILDVGGGWGPLTEQVLDYRPRASVTLVDYSPPMLAHARRRLAAYGDRVRFAQRDLTTPAWPEDLGHPFDAVVSSLAIHNLRDPAVIARVYGDIAHLLGPGGCFFNLEIVPPAGPALGAVVRRLGADAADGDPDQAEPVASADRQAPSAVAPEGAGPPGSLARQLAQLRSAGFAEVDCLWRDGVTALLAAVTAP